MKALVLTAALALVVGVAFAEDTIYDIQNGTIAPGTAVTVEGVVVTGAPADYYGGGYCYASEPGGGPFSGVMVYWGSAGAALYGGLQRGDVINLTGETTEYWDKTEVLIDSLDTIIVTGTAAVPGPDPVNLPFTEEWEGCFIVTPCTVVETEQNSYYEWSFSDHGEFGIADDGTAIYLTYVPAIGDQKVLAGCLDYNFDEYKLYPRDDADITDCQYTSTDAASWGNVKALFR